MRVRDLCLLIFLALALTACGTARGMLVDVAPASLPANARLERVLVATSRATADDPAIYFDRKRGQRLNYAEMTVSIPPSHRPGEIELSPTGRPDPARYFVPAGRRALDGDQQFLNRVNAEIARNSPQDREVFVFVHGFNNTFAEALYRTAQIRHDFDFPAVPVVYSWPSAGKATLYAYDSDSAIYGRDGLVDLLTLINRSSAKRVILVGHSMGGFVVMEALRQAKLAGKSGALSKLSLVALASPDIDIDTFRAQVAALSDQRPRMVVLVSRDDRALRISQRLHGGRPRLGQVSEGDELPKQGVLVIDLSDVSEGDKLGHSTFSTSPSFIRLVRNREISRETVASADRRSRVAEVTPGSLITDAATLVVTFPETVLTGQ